MGRRITVILMLLGLAIVIAACTDTNNTAGSSKAITAFSIDGVAGTINETNKTIAVTMPFGTNLTSQIATFSITGTGVTVSGTAQTSAGTANNFSSPVIYTISAADNSTANYTVTVTVAPSSAKEITAFSLNGVVGTINETNKTITVTTPFGTNITSQIATFSTTGTGVTVSGTAQISANTVNNFSSPVIYTISAADNSTADYTITVVIAPSSAKAITAFSLDGVVGTISEANKTIAVTMPFGTNITSLVATFSTSGVSATVNGTTQTSGTTANNFTSPVAYTVKAADNSTATYTATAAVALASCTDGIKNGDESDVDCGGSCSACLNSQICNVNNDCSSSDCMTGICSNNKCATVPTVSGTACTGGGICNGSGQCVGCVVNADCSGSSSCSTAICINNSCGTVYMSSGTSCTGGGHCNGSGACLLSCVVNSDCQSNAICVNYTCSVPLFP